MTQMELPQTGSQFDRTRREDDYGEHWTGRDLMPLMEYSRWEKFAAVIEKAKSSLAVVQGQTAADLAFAQVTQVHQMGNLGEGTRVDYRLTRFGAYLTAMAGDDTKKAVARARVYFAVRTREAEVAPQPAVALPDMSTPEGRLQVAELLLAGARREIELSATVADRDAQLAIAAPKAEYVDGFVNPDEDASLIRVFAGQLNVGEKALRAWLVDRKVIYRRTVGQRWSNSQGRLVSEYEWLAHAAYRSWFKPADQPNAPSLHNGQTATTLYVTPVGKVAIRRLLMRHPLDGTAA